MSVQEPEAISGIDTSKMSEGKRAALELAESARTPAGEMPSFAAPLFFGDFGWPLVHPFPEEPAESAARGEEFLGALGALLDAKLDADEVDRTGEIPDELVDGLRALGAFGIKIPREFGGLGLSQTTYTRAAMLVGGRCASTAAMLSAHQSIGVPQPLLLFGTDEQKARLLPRLAKGELSAFAITEAEAGSDPARMTSRAVPSADGTHYVLSGEKLWCTNGTRAKWLVVAAKTPGRAGRGDGITAFIVDAESPGVTVVQRCRFMGMRAIYNAVLRFDGVRVPASNVLGGEGRGLKVALTTLNTGRLTLPAACVGVSRDCLAIARRWAGSREQWGSPIGRHAAVAEKLARMAADLFAMESMTLLTSALVDRHDTDIRVEAAMCKLWGTEAAWRIINDAVQVKGGRGYETAESLAARGEAPDPLERYLRDNRIYTIFEGSSEILRLFLAREALDPHLKVAGAVLDSRLPRGRRFRAGLKAGGFYATWYAARLLPPSAPGGALHRAVASQIAYCARTSRRLARALFRAMVRRGTAIEREQVLLGRFVDVGTEVFALSASCTRAQHLLDRGAPHGEVLPVLDLVGRTARARIDASFRGTRRHHDDAGYALAQEVLDGRHAWLERPETAAAADTMDQETAFVALGVALGVGLLIGFEREQALRAETKEDGATMGGVRTYPLVSLAGALATLVARGVGAWLVALAFAALAALVGISYADNVRRRNDRGATSDVAMLLTFLLGALAASNGVLESPKERMAVVFSVAVVVTLILSMKPPLHRLARSVTKDDVYATVKFLLAAVVLLPLLPNRTYGPFDVINPAKIGLLIVLIAGIGFAGYVAVRVLGPGRGLGLTGLIGGLVSSTAVTLASASRAKREPELAPSCALAVVLANTVMAARVLAVVVVVNPALAGPMAGTIACIVAVGAGASWVFWRRAAGARAKSSDELEVKNPFGLGSAVKLGLLLAAVLFVTKAAAVRFGTGAIYATSLLAGSTDVNTVSVSMAELAKGQIAPPVAVTAILLAVASNTVVKAAIASVAGGWAFGRLFVVPSAATVVAAAAGIAWVQR